MRGYLLKSGQLNNVYTAEEHESPPLGPSKGGNGRRNVEHPL